MVHCLNISISMALVFRAMTASPRLMTARVAAFPSLGEAASEDVSDSVALGSCAGLVMRTAGAGGREVVDVGGSGAGRSDLEGCSQGSYTVQVQVSGGGGGVRGEAPSSSPSKSNAMLHIMTKPGKQLGPYVNIIRIMILEKVT